MTEVDLEFRQIDWACSAQNKDLLPGKKSGKSLKAMGQERRLKVKMEKDGNQKSN